MSSSFTDTQLDLHFMRCARCNALDRDDWIRQRAARTNGRVWCRGTKERGCTSRSFSHPVNLSENETAQITAGWFEDDSNAG